jgi:hypothetical protein
MGHRHSEKGASLVPIREALLFERRLVAKHLVLGLLVSVLLSGCGASDEEQVRETIERFNRAAAEGDGKEACDQLTPGAQATGGLRCESVIDQLGRLGGKAAKRRLAAVEVRNVTVSGKTAMAEAQVPTQSPHDASAGEGPPAGVQMEDLRRGMEDRLARTRARRRLLGR